jgi:hypothetical protein
LLRVRKKARICNDAGFPWMPFCLLLAPLLDQRE